MKRIIIIGMASLLCVFAGCKTETAEKTEPVVPETTKVQVIVTAKDTSDRLTEQEPIAFADVAIAMGETITIDASKTYQSITGFGGSFTEATAYTLSKLSPDKRAEVIKAYFDPIEGNGYTLCRPPHCRHSCQAKSPHC